MNSIEILREQFEMVDLQLIEARKAIRTREYILSLMESLDRQLAEKRRELSLLATQLENEKQDIEVLEAYTVEALVSAILDKKERQLQKETAEYWQIKLYYNKCNEAIFTLEARLSELGEQLVALADCDETYEQLQKERENLIVQLATPQSQRFAEVSDSLNKKLIMYKGIEKALEDGTKVLSAFQKITYILVQGPDKNSLQKAIHQTQQQLDDFQTTLTGISYQFHPPLHINAPNLKENDPLSWLFAGSLLGLLLDATPTETRPEGEWRHWLYHLQQLQKKVGARMTHLQTQLEDVQISVKRLQKEQEELIRQIWYSLGLLR